MEIGVYGIRYKLNKKNCKETKKIWEITEKEIKEIRRLDKLKTATRLITKKAIFKWEKLGKEKRPDQIKIGIIKEKRKRIKESIVR